MLTVRKSADRGRFDFGWLKTAHTFSFGDYHDRAHMGFGPLRVINEDVVAPGQGFGEHPHKDMEIITYPLSGTVRHRDSLGHAEDIVPGQIQRMTAGSGIRHSEFNPSSTEPTHLLQIWIRPTQRDLTPGHETRGFPVHDEPGRLHLLASADGRDGSLAINQDARVYAGVFGAGGGTTLALGAGRGAWVQVARGSVRVNGVELGQGDGAALTGEPTLELEATDTAEVIVFEVEAA